MLLRLGYDEPLSNFAFKFNLRRYTKIPTGLMYNAAVAAEMRRYFGKHKNEARR
jgi:hypothetical protein